VRARVIVPRRDAERIGALLFEHATTGIEEAWLPGEAPPVRQPWDTGPGPALPERVVLVAWWPERDFPRAAVERVLADAGAALESWDCQDDGDWAEAWKVGFERVVISAALAVAPTWLAKPGDVVLEPGMAFGTGTHPSTRACLEAIDRWAIPGARCLDVGCGSGVLALAATHLGMANCWGIDVDPEAVRMARLSAAGNGLDVRFDATPLSRVTGHFDLVVANLYAELVVALSDDLLRLAQGRLVLAGLLIERADPVLALLAGFASVQTRRSGDWLCVEATR